MKKLAEIREKIAQIESEIEQTLSAPRPVDEAVAIVAQAFDRASDGDGAAAIRGLITDANPEDSDAARSVALSPVLLINGVQRHREPDSDESAAIDFSAAQNFQSIGASIQALIALIGREHIERTAREILVKEAERWPKGIPVAERRETLTKLRAKLAELELAEEAAILDLETDSYIPRRPTVDAKIIARAWLQLTQAGWSSK